jgi:hypothetical protein
MLEDSSHGVLRVSSLFGRIESTGVILSHANDQLIILLKILEFMRSSNDFDSASVESVVGAAGDDGAAANKVTVLVEEDASPGELPGAGLSMLETTDRTGKAPDATLQVPSLGRGFIAPLFPMRLLLLLRLKAVSAEHGEVNFRGEAAGFVSSRAASHLLIAAAATVLDIHNPVTYIWAGIGVHPLVNET